MGSSPDLSLNLVVQTPLCLYPGDPHVSNAYPRSYRSFRNHAWLYKWCNPMTWGETVINVTDTIAVYTIALCKTHRSETICLNNSSSHSEKRERCDDGSRLVRVSSPSITRLCMRDLLVSTGAPSCWCTCIGYGIQKTVRSAIPRQLCTAGKCPKHICRRSRLLSRPAWLCHWAFVQIELTLIIGYNFGILLLQFALHLWTMSVPSRRPCLISSDHTHQTTV